MCFLIHQIKQVFNKVGSQATLSDTKKSIYQGAVLQVVLVEDTFGVGETFCVTLGSSTPGTW